MRMSCSPWSRTRGSIGDGSVGSLRRRLLPKRLRSLLWRFNISAKRLRWLANDDDIQRWKGVLAPHLDEGPCTCGGTTSPAPSGHAQRDWGVICCSGGGVRSAAFSLADSRH